MNKLIFKAVFIVLILIPILAIGQVKKEKKIEKTFQISPNGSLAIDNKYGDVHIETWDKDRVEITVTIDVTKRSESKAQDVIDRIDVEIRRSGNNLSFETTFEGSMSNRGNDKLKIDYDVHAPEQLSMNLENSYGNLYLSKATGEIALKIAYGNLKIDNLLGNTELKLSYGNGEIESFNNGELIVSYSNLTIEEAGDVDITNNYSNIEIGNAGEVKSRNKYGNITLASTKRLNGFSKYGNVTIDKLYESIIFEVLHGGGLKVNWISKDFTLIDVESSYATVQFRFEKGIGATLDAEMKYCDLKNYDVDFDYSFIDESGNMKSYKGKLGDKSRNSKIKVRSSYGSVKMRYAY